MTAAPPNPPNRGAPREKPGHTTRGAHGGPPSWPAVSAATAHDATARLPFFIADAGAQHLVGSVARQHLDALSAWPQALHLANEGLTLVLPAPERADFFDRANGRLREQGLIVAWRDETYPVHALVEGAPGPLLATFERAASRFWGTLTFGAHCNGYVAGADGRPSHLWIARRSLSKPTDPGLLDNLVGGGVPFGQTPWQAVVREGWEEAGLRPAQMAAATPGRRIHVARDIPEGFQRELVSVFDLCLPAELQPHNQDGEVLSITCLPVAQALAHAEAGEMTVDAALVTLDFALRHRLLDAARHAALAQASQALWLAAPVR